MGSSLGKFKLANAEYLRYFICFGHYFMTDKITIHTKDAPAPIGSYSQAIKIGNNVYLSGQIPLDPKQGVLVVGGVERHVKQVFDNLAAIAKAAGGDLDRVVKLTIFLTDLANFSIVNTVMADYFKPPYPARSTLGVASLPKGASVEIEAIMILN